MLYRHPSSASGSSGHSLVVCPLVRSPSAGTGVSIRGPCLYLRSVPDWYARCRRLAPFALPRCFLQRRWVISFLGRGHVRRLLMGWRGPQAGASAESPAGTVLTVDGGAVLL